MSERTTRKRDTTTLRVYPTTRDRLGALKPYDSMSYDDLLKDMAEVYEEQRD